MVQNLQEFNPLEETIKMTLDRLSNGEPVTVQDEWIEQAVEEFRQALIKQLKPQERAFGLRMSNLGRPLCQLQNEKDKAPKERMEYNHIVRMMIGDAVEVLSNLYLKIANVNVTASKQRKSLVINGTLIEGEEDIEIDHKVYDVKSSSSYAFTHKWAEGWNGVYYGDSFGYVAQLYGYAEADPDKMGGWIVWDKSSGELKVVEAKPTPVQIEELKASIDVTVEAIQTDAPFRKVFEPEEETYYKKPTGNTLVPLVCTFCQFKKTCWPDAVLKPKALSKAQNPKPVWYVSYYDQEG